MVFPRLVRRSKGQILILVLRLFLCFVLLVFLVAQVFRPTLNNLMEELNELKGEDMHILSVHIFAEYILKLGIASSYIWLLVFYGFFHVLLNLLAQLLRFGDRVFYRDWWNSTNMSSYWRLWNLPVHYWLVRHLYFPCIRLGISKSAAMFIVFFFSAVVHEMLISVSLFDIPNLDSIPIGCRNLKILEII
ncbi:MAG: diacylglycerol O-acyltransferase-1 [Bacillariaceae sp.]|jgi:diacylglycerol O-acyltransferase-1